MSGKYMSPSVSEESTYLSEWLIHWGNASCISCIYICIGLDQGDMTEAEGFGVAVHAYYYAVITTPPLKLDAVRLASSGARPYAWEGP